MGMMIDSADFEKGFMKLIERTIPPELEKGIFAAGNELLNDAVKEPPQAPKDLGFLWRSKRMNKVKVGKGEISVEGGFNIEYAARWHELSPAEDSRINWTTTKGADQPGRKYLETKMVRYKEKYMEIVAEFLKKVMR